jgi:glycosyltransferase involved in cell wall biosynthesis
LLPDFVEFRGAVDPVAPLYRQADVLVITSDREGTPNVVLEAMASGLPVVATHVGGIPDLVQHGVTGFLAESADSAALLAALQCIVSDRDLRVRMGDRARAYALAHHALSQLPARLERLYGSVLS